MLSLLTRQTAAGLRILVAFTLLCGVLYPAAVWAVAQIPGLAHQADGSAITAADGTVVGSSLIGIDPIAADPGADPWFHTRPSAAPDGASGGSNKSTVNPDLLAAVDRATGAHRPARGRRSGAGAAGRGDGVGVRPGSRDLAPPTRSCRCARVAEVTGLPDRPGAGARRAGHDRANPGLPG